MSISVAVMIEHFKDALTAREMKPKTQSLYVRYAEKFVGFAREAFPEWMPVNQSAVDQELVARFAEFLKQESPIATSTLNAAITAVTRFYSINGVRTRFRIQQAVPIELPPMLTEAELQRIEAILPTCSAKQQLMVTLILRCGLLPSELLQLRPRNFAFASDSLLSIRFNDRCWEICEPAVIASFRAIVQRHQADVPIFVNAQGAMMSTAGLDFAIKTVGQKARVLLSARLLRNTHFALAAKQKFKHDVSP